jgi:hypothetical protein
VRDRKHSLLRKQDEGGATDVQAAQLPLLLHNFFMEMQLRAAEPTGADWGRGILAEIVRLGSRVQPISARIIHRRVALWAG